jgi:hypothetical protein
MIKLRNIFQYWKQYGTAGTFGLSFEKLLIDPRRFDVKALGLPMVPVGQTVRVAQEEPTRQFEPWSLCYLIHYFYPEKRGGTERFILNLAHQQQMDGSRVLVVTLGNRILRIIPCRSAIFSGAGMITRKSK